NSPAANFFRSAASMMPSLTSSQSGRMAMLRVRPRPSLPSGLGSPDLFAICGAHRPGKLLGLEVVFDRRPVHAVGLEPKRREIRELMIGSYLRIETDRVGNRLHPRHG